MDTSGRIIQSYGGPTGSFAGYLHGPICLAVDTRDHVLVADWYNDKVQILSPALTYLGHVALPKHKLSRPYRLPLDDVRGRLYVGEGSNEFRLICTGYVGPID